MARAKETTIRLQSLCVELCPVHRKDHSRKPTAATLIMREDIQEMTTTDQIVLIEQLAEKITSNAGENVSRSG